VVVVELATRGLPRLPGPEVRVVVAVEMDLVRRAAHPVATKQLVLQVGQAGRRGQRDEQVLVALELVRDAARLDLPRPAHQPGHAHATLPGGALLAPERGVAALS